MRFKTTFLYWTVPVLAFLPQLFMTLNSFSQVRFEEFITSVQAPYWLYQHQIIGGLHVNVAWYAFLIIIYKIFGFSLFTGRIVYLFISLISLFILSFLLKKFFDLKIAALILITLALSPTWLFINSLNMHMAMIYHLLIIMLLILIRIDFSKKLLSLVLTGLLFLLMMISWFTYQPAACFIPSLFIFYFWKLRKYNHYKNYKSYILTAVVSFLLPVVMLFLWVDNKQILILDPERGSGLFRGGGQFIFSGDVFAQNWSNFLTDFFIKGVSGHYEVYIAEFSLIFPVITIFFVFYSIRKTYQQIGQSRKIILLVMLVMIINLLIFSFTNALTLPGMNRITPLLLSFYFWWVLVWYYEIQGKTGKARFAKRGKVLGMVILSLVTIHHLIVYPVNLTHIKDPSPFKVTDWFDGENPQKPVDEYVKLAQKQDLLLDCRPILAGLGQCFYDFIYPAVAGSCSWNHYKCHNILGYDPKSRKFIPLTIKLWQQHYFEP